MVEIDKAPWFVVADVCEALGLNPHVTNGSYQHHYRSLSPEQVGLANVRQPTGRGCRMKLVSEAALYALVMRSIKPEAKAFQDWVTGTVLPVM